VHFSGTAISNETLSDSIFPVSAENALRFRRKVEMYQWLESESTSTSKSVGGSSTKKTTYKYSTNWDDDLENSDNFKNPSGHENPKQMPFDAETINAENIQVNVFPLPENLKNKLGRFEKVNLEPELAARV